MKVGYDVKAAGNQIKNDIKNERQSLKSILNEEYGWFKNDSAVNKNQKPGTPRFKIKWGEEDSTNIVKEQPVIKKENLIKNIFKR